MDAQSFWRAQRGAEDPWPHQFLHALRGGLSGDDQERWLPEFRRRFRNRVPDFAGQGLFHTLLGVESLEPGELADLILDQVFLTLRRNQPREDGALVEYIRAIVRSVAVTLRRQSLDSFERAAVQDETVQVVSLDEQPMLLEHLAGDEHDTVGDLAGKRVVHHLLALATSHGERENVEIVLRATLEDVALADIARERGCSRQAVQKRYQRGLSYLREHAVGLGVGA